ncbi:transcriptional regulator [Streptomyces sp. MUSC 14]|uniref:ArsR/SmtB family transcription factor n=1 Tax=Streptomyces sp. MUSC 14 TaxID=1354889 RepID=UPI0008F5C6BC|nr:winged helix-turn-helix domain-containing protein [Streptomyces sp. MUSC 14]OIJ90346.1 transcriptional regulator [Streptomyces sp. MUSC 14]
MSSTASRLPRGLAHPLRMELLKALRHGGPATASQLAERLGESSGATSYHLRQLAAHGFVEDAAERGKGRERWWKAADQGLVFDSDEFQDADPQVRGAMNTFLHEVANTHTRELSTWLATRNEWSHSWARSTDVSDMTLRLTPELAQDLVGRMHALIDEFRTMAPARDTPEAETVRIHTRLFPTKTD